MVITMRKRVSTIIENLILKALVFLALLCKLQAGVSAATLHVSPGDSGNACSTVTPCALDSAITDAPNRGYVLFFKEGLMRRCGNCRTA